MVERGSRLPRHRHIAARRQARLAHPRLRRRAADAEPIMKQPVRRIADPIEDPASYLTREWLITNGQGGYASGTVAGILTRRYHGVLVAALPAPIGRIVMLSAVEARL